MFVVKVRSKIRTCYYLDEITKFENFDFDNIFNRQKITRKYFYV